MASTPEPSLGQPWHLRVPSPTRRFRALRCPPRGDVGCTKQRTSATPEPRSRRSAAPSPAPLLTLPLYQQPLSEDPQPLRRTLPPSVLSAAPPSLQQQRRRRLSLRQPRIEGRDDPTLQWAAWRAPGEPLTVDDAIAALRVDPSKVWRLCRRTHGRWRQNQASAVNKEEDHVTDTLVAAGPYDLVVCPPLIHITEEWLFTADGVRSRDPIGDEQVCTLEEWLRERRLYCALRALPFLRTYIIRKCLQVWRQRVRRRLFMAARSTVGQRLLALRPAYKGTLLRIRGVLEEIRSVALLHFPASVPGLPTECLATDFLRAQEVAAADTSERLRELAEDAKDAVASCAADALASVHVPEARDASELAELLPAPSSHPRAVVSHLAGVKSMLHDGARLGAAVRLCDLMFTDGLVRHSLNACSDLTAALRGTADAPGVQLSFRTHLEPPPDPDSDLVVIPDERTLRGVISACVDHVLQLCDGVPTVVPDTEKVEASGSRSAAARTAPFFAASMAKQDRTIADAHAAAAVYAARRRDCARWLQWITSSWPETRRQWEDDPENVSVQDFLSGFKKVDEASSGVDSMLLNAHVGGLYFNHASLRGALMPALMSARRWLRSALIAAAADRSGRLREDLLAVLSTLRERAEDLDEWAAWVERLNGEQQRREELLERLGEVAALFALITDHNARCGSDCWGVHDELLIGSEAAPSLRDQLLSSLHDADEFRQSKLADQKRALDERVEGLQTQCKQQWADAMEGMFTDPASESGTVLEELEKAQSAVDELTSAAATCTRYQKLCRFDVSEWEALRGAAAAVSQRQRVWSTLADFERLRDVAHSSTMQQLNADKLKLDLEDCNKKAFKLVREVGDEVSARLQREVKGEQQLLPLAAELSNKAMLPCHWEKVCETLEVEEGSLSEATTFTALLDKGAGEHRERIEEISAIASGEYAINGTLDEVERIWSQMNFEVKQHRDAGDVFILGSLEEIIQQLEDHQLQMQATLASRYVAGVRDRTELWDKKLALVAEVLDEWVQVQHSWIYLEFIFRSPDIKDQLPAESQSFDAIDVKFKELMRRAHKEGNVADICANDGVLSMLRVTNTTLQDIQKRLEEYLETKREAFPRFYFLSNDELLSILSDVRNPRSVQPHLVQIFDNMKSVTFADEEGVRIGGMVSGEGEKVSFSEEVVAVGLVEAWLSKIESAMKASLRDHMRTTLQGYTSEGREEWYFQYPAQCICTVDMIMWTQETEEALGRSALADYIKSYIGQIAKSVEVVKRDLKKLERKVLCTVILVDVHNRDCLQLMLDEGVQDPTSFEWSRQLRFYWEEDDCWARHCSAKFLYGYEYLGNQPRLVITELTDRAFLTCTGALSMNLGAAPQGPAGTGKTESVKDLGKALARQVVVFNCSDGLNHKMMSQMFAGLAQAGAWACFDEFNRIPLEVLSVVAQQMLEITEGLKKKMDRMIFDGHMIRLHQSFGVFITMNPGYAGRTELPDNLKALFRPVCMMIPDYALIAEIMLFSEGYQGAGVLARKMVQLYKLSSEQLSKQDHYDFGMRAVKSILVMAGTLKRASPGDPEDMLLIRAMRDANVPKFLHDDTILFLALIQDLFPSVVMKEAPVEDLRRIVVEDIQANGLETVKEFIVKVMQLYDTMVVRHGVMTVGLAKTGKTAILEILQRSLTRAKDDEVDPSGENQMFNVVVPHWMNPKSVTMGELYGEVSLLTQEWTDGILSKIARGVVEGAARGTQDRQWIIFDGPVDAIWIENMNTVLDDNRMLCLVNGERIKIPLNTTFVFEVQDLRVASPATVSRCGMVYMEASYMDYRHPGGWRPPAISQSRALAGKLGPHAWNHELVMSLLDATVQGALKFLRNNCGEWIPSADSQLVEALLKLLHGLVVEHYGALGSIPEEEPAVQPSADARALAGTVLARRASLMTQTQRRRSSLKDAVLRGAARAVKTLGGAIRNVVQYTHYPSPPEGAAEYEKLFKRFFALSLVWSIGGNVSDASRAKFAAFAADHLRSVCDDLPADGTVYDISVDTKSRAWQTWAAQVPVWKYDSKLPYFELTVPTPQTVCFSKLLTLLTSVNSNVLLNGVTGVGKSVVIQSFIFDVLKADDPAAKWEFFSIVFSAQTSSRNLQEKIETKLHKKKNSLFGASPGKQIVFFIDDMNMPALEEYGASPPLELVRQMISHGGFFDRKRMFFKNVEDIICIGACGVPGGGKNEMTQRLTARFHLLCTPDISESSMRKIFTEIVGGFLAQWPEDVRCGAELADNVVRATQTAFYEITKTLLPTPSKSHYTFNLRDVSKVVQGFLQVRPETTPTKEGLVKLWCHEASRVFHDRLIDEHDKEWWFTLCERLVTDLFKVEWKASHRTLLFGDYLSDVETRLYKEMDDSDAVTSALEDYQEQFNVQMNAASELVFFHDAVAHLTRITRIIRQPRGNALLVGVGGSGRQSLSMLATFICGMTLFRIAITRQYGMTEFREDLRKVLLDAGCSGQGIVFLLTDSQIINEAMLEDLNNVLNTGEVPNLMQPEDYDRIVAEVRPHVQKAGKQETRSIILQMFIERCREFCKIVFAVSPVGDKFRDRLRRFPSLVNCMAIDWYTRWPNEALLGVAERTCRKMNELGGDTAEEVARLKSVAAICVQIHSDVQKASDRFWDQLRRRAYTTPTSYLSLLSLYSSMLAANADATDDAMDKYQSGLEKLEATQGMVDGLKGQLREMQPKLIAASADAEVLMKNVQKEQEEADVLRADCKRSEEETLAIKDDAQGIKDECESELAKAMPAYFAALEALKALNKGDITEIRSMTTPPERVKLVLDAVMLLLGEKSVWEDAKKVMGKMDFLDRLRGFDKDNVPEKLLKSLQKYITHPEFQPEIVKKSSVAAMSLCLWVRAIDNYSSVAKNIAPKKESLAKAEEELGHAQAKLDAAQAQLQEVEDKVAGLQRKMQDAVDTKDSLENQQLDTQARLDRAEKLIGGLSSEQVRWLESRVRLATDRPSLIGTTLLAAGCIAYLGPFTALFRDELVARWTEGLKAKQVPCSSSFSLETVADPVKVRQWGIDGLPLDPFSIENATIVTKGRRWPLCVDPQSQASMWIKNTERGNGLKVTKLNDPNIMRVIEGAIRVGTPVLLENVGEELDAALDPVLQKAIFMQAGRPHIRLGDTDVEYNDSFRLYITSKMPNPHYLPELQIKVTLVNFTVTQKGLEDQLLADVVRYERADLEERKNEMVMQIANGKAQLVAIEDKILRLLAAAAGDILDDEVLINTLAESKVTSTSINASLIEVQRTSVEIDQARERYRPVANRGSILYTTVSDIARVDHMYQYSLEFFKGLFGRTLENTRNAPDVDERVEILLPAVTEDVYRTICRGLFAKDKGLFAFLLMGQVCLTEKSIPAAEWSFFLRGASGALAADGEEEPGDEEEEDDGADRVGSWLTSAQRQQIVGLAEVCPIFKTMESAISSPELGPKLEKWYRSESPHTEMLPPPFLTATPWQRLLLLRVLREDKVIFGLSQAVGHFLGSNFTEPPPFDLGSAFADSTVLSPMVFVLTAGTDPTAGFLEFAEKRGMQDRKLMLSLGQDQGRKARSMIEQGVKSGEWVYLQNCHVYGSWMPQLEQIMEGLSVLRDEGGIHPEFRLWLTSMPSADFPVSILQAGVKITKEPPEGLKANLRDSFVGVMTDELWDAVPEQRRSWRRLLFALTFFHGIVQERRKFGALGWNIRYEWNQADLDASVITLRRYLEEATTGIPWPALKYLTGTIHYGGRVTDFLDLRCLRTILSRFFDEAVLEPGAHKITPDGVYRIPETELECLPAVHLYLSQLPPHEEPALFGLHQNANMSYERAQSRRVVALVVSLQPRDASGGAGRSPDQIVEDIASDLHTRLPQPIDPKAAHPDTYRVVGEGDLRTVTPLGTFCAQEVEIFNRILKKTKTSLEQLRRALKGEVVMSAELETIHTAFLLGKVPALWHKNSYLSLKPVASWFADTIQRIGFLRDWNNSGPPSSFWVPGFYFPQGFMTAVLQVHSREHKVPIDELCFKTTVSDSDEQDDPPESGTQTHGYFIEGARWDSSAGCIAESNRGELTQPVPPVVLEPVSRVQLLEQQRQEAAPYRCPVYKVSSRSGTLSTTGLSTNFVLSIDLSSGESAPEHWTLRGVAFLCMLDD